MLRDHLLPAPGVVIDSKLSNLLLKVIKQDNSNLLLQYLITNIDKRSDDFAEICELKYLQTDKDKFGVHNDLEQLSRALSSDQEVKANYFLSKP